MWQAVPCFPATNLRCAPRRLAWRSPPRSHTVPAGVPAHVAECPACAGENQRCVACRATGRATLLPDELRRSRTGFAEGSSDLRRILVRIGTRRDASTARAHNEVERPSPATADGRPRRLECAPARLPARRFDAR